MVLKYKNTIYEPIFKVTNEKEGLGPNDFWVNIEFKLKNEEIDYEGNFFGMSFKELIRWNDVNKRFLESKIKYNAKVCFIRRIGELIYYPEKSIVEKKLFLYDNVSKYYTIYIEKDELEEIYIKTKKFIDTVNLTNDKTGILD